MGMRVCWALVKSARKFIETHIFSFFYTAYLCKFIWTHNGMAVDLSRVTEKMESIIIIITHRYMCVYRYVTNRKISNECMRYVPLFGLYCTNSMCVQCQR